MTRMDGLRGVLVVSVALGLTGAARAQLGQSFGGADAGRALIDDTKKATPDDDNPFGAAEKSPDRGKKDKSQRAVAEHAVDVSSDDVLSFSNLRSGLAGSNVHVREALKSPTRMEFTEMPLVDAVAYLKDFHGIEIQVDQRALKEADIGSDTPFTRNLNGLPLGSSLRLLLEEHGLTYLVRDGVLIITTEPAARKYLELKVYDVTKLIGDEVKAEEIAVVLASLDQIQGAGGMGGMGGGAAQASTSHVRVVPFRNLLIVRASQHEHEEIARLFSELKSQLDADD